jgi:protein-S-isoprenylcysteine O-methyltransferase Ste14
MNALTVKALVVFVRRLVFLSLAIFLSAGSLDFWEAWVFLPAFFIPYLLILLYLRSKDPDLLARRLKGSPTAESRTWQKVIMSLMSLGFVLLMLVSGLAHRFDRSPVPAILVIAADVGVLLGFLIQFQVFKANTFASAIVAIVPEQKVISTGPYALVRHPMYAGALVVDFCIPIALGSWWGLPFVLGLLGVIILRLLDEEKLLRQDLPGYEEYCRKVPNRLIPRLW